jgi:hypothetical protein
MATKKAKDKVARRTAKAAARIKLLRVEKLEEDKHLVELEIHGGPELPNEAQLPTEPLALDTPSVQENSWLKWWRSLWY